METRKRTNYPFLMFIFTIYEKPMFSGVYSNFESFLPSSYKFSVEYTVVYIVVFAFAQIGHNCILN